MRLRQRSLTPREWALGGLLLIILSGLGIDHAIRWIYLPYREDLQRQNHQQEYLLARNVRLQRDAEGIRHAFGSLAIPDTTTDRGARSEAQILRELQTLSRGKVVMTSMSPSVRGQAMEGALTVTLEFSGDLWQSASFLTTVANRLGGKLEALMLMSGRSPTREPRCQATLVFSGHGS